LSREIELDLTGVEEEKTKTLYKYEADIRVCPIHCCVQCIYVRTATKKGKCQTATWKYCGLLDDHYKSKLYDKDLYLRVKEGCPLSKAEKQHLRVIGKKK
jgi:hypothetical protein